MSKAGEPERQVRTPQSRSEGVADAGEIKRRASGDWLVEGYRRALARLRDAESKLDKPRETYIALFEALNWAASITYYLKDQERPRLPRAAAVMWIRGRVQHKWAEAIELRPISGSDYVELLRAAASAVPFLALAKNERDPGRRRWP